MKKERWLGALFVLVWMADGRAAAQTLVEKSFQVRTEAEAVLRLTAASEGASWRERGREAAVVKVFVDDKYHHDVILFGGADPFTYRQMLGRVVPGGHRVRVELNREQSAVGATKVNVIAAEVELVDQHAPGFIALMNAPIIYARADTIGKFSDVPLLAYADCKTMADLSRCRYTVIFSNEDGGTNTTALMARWGRTTDIEWVCETTHDGKARRSEVMFQGVNHVDTKFAGKFEAGHPIFLDASVNNNFADQGETVMRFAPAPIAFDEAKASREEVMDAHPWTYRVMADEMIREGKISRARQPGQQIPDLRNYVYLDVTSQQTGGLFSLAVKLKGDARWYTSDWGISSYKVERSGHFRTTVWLPRRIRLDEIERIAARCDVKGDPKTADDRAAVAKANCALQAINKVFVLGEDYLPQKEWRPRMDAVKIEFGEMIEIYRAEEKR